MINSILNDIRSRHEAKKHFYPTENLFVGITQKTVTENNLNYTYSHWDCFLANDLNIHHCTELKLITGNNTQYIPINNTNLNEEKQFFANYFTLKSKNNNHENVTYTVYTSHRLLHYMRQEGYITTYPQNICIEKIQNFIDTHNHNASNEAKQQLLDSQNNENFISSFFEHNL